MRKQTKALPKPVAVLNHTESFDDDHDVQVTLGVEAAYVEELKACAEILSNYRGSVSPFEEFFHQLLVLHMVKKQHGEDALTPSDVRELLDGEYGFQYNFDAQVSDVRWFLGRYPDTVNNRPKAESKAS